jgi:glycosyltransferase involved in cell wall biosynthesis
LKLARLRVVVTHHGCDYDAEKWNALLRGLLRLGEHIGVRFADAVICVSDTLRRDVESRFGVQARTIYNGAQIKPKIRPAARQLQALRANSYVLMVGRITKHKRVLDVIEAMDCPRLRDTPLVVCGSLDRADPNVTAVLAAAKNRPNVLLAGFVAPEHLPWLYARALCTVMASSYEGMPLAVLEALAAGSSVLLSDIPAHRELSLPPEQYVAVGNVSAIRTRLVRLWDERRRTPLRGRRPAVDPRFEWATIAQQTAAVFDAVARRLRRDGHAQRAPSPASSGGPSRSSGTLADSSGP